MHDAQLGTVGRLMKDLKSIRAIIFDLDDTLVGSDDFYAKALLKMKVDPVGKPFLEARAQMKAQLPPGHVVARNRLLYFKRMLENRKQGFGLGALDMMLRYEA